MINHIQKGILDISSKEDPYDVFICYKETDQDGGRTEDSVLAQDIYDALTKEGYKVFFSRITLEEKLGTEYEPYIFAALNSAKVMLVVGTSPENMESVWVKNEWSRYLEFMKKDKSKTLIPVYKKIDAYDLPDSFSMLQAQSMDKIGAMQDLVRGIGKIITASKKNKNDDFTYEMYEKFKQMKEEEDREIKESQAANKQVEKVYVTTTRSYKIITFMISLIQAILIFDITADETYFVKGYYSGFNFTQLGINTPVFIILITCIITFIGYFVSISSKKGNLASKFMYSCNTLLLFTLYIRYSNLGYHLTPIFTAFVLTNIVLLILKPKWKLVEKVMYVTTEEKKEVLEYNKKVKLEFTEKDKFPKYLLIIMLLTIIIFIGGVIYNYSIELKSQSNARDKSLQQLEIKYEYINIREKPSISERIIGKVYRGDIFTILDVTKKSNSAWYKITTEYGITGYIYSGKNNEYVIIYNAEK